VKAATGPAVVACVGVAGAAQAWAFLRHGAWAWVGVGALAAVCILAEAAFRVGARRVGRDPLSGRIWMEVGTPPCVLAGAVAAAALIAWIGSEALTLGRSKEEQRAVGVGMGAVAAALATVVVDPLKHGGLAARRIRNRFAREYRSRPGLPRDLELLLDSPAQSENWATRADRRARAQDFAPFARHG